MGQRVQTIKDKLPGVVGGFVGNTVEFIDSRGILLHFPSEQLEWAPEGIPGYTWNQGLEGFVNKEGVLARDNIREQRFQYQNELWERLGESIDKNHERWVHLRGIGDKNKGKTNVMRKETWDYYIHNPKMETAGVLMDGFEISGPDKRVYYANDVYTDKNGVDMLDLVLVKNLTVHSKMPIKNIGEHFLSVPKGYDMPWGPKEPEKPHTLYEQSAQENKVSFVADVCPIPKRRQLMFSGAAGRKKRPPPPKKASPRRNPLKPSLQYSYLAADAWDFDPLADSPDIPHAGKHIGDNPIGLGVPLLGNNMFFNPDQPFQSRKQTLINNLWFSQLDQHKSHS